jgi:hypothetical protein
MSDHMALYAATASLPDREAPPMVEVTAWPPRVDDVSDRSTEPESLHAVAKSSTANRAVGVAA